MRSENAPGLSEHLHQRLRVLPGLDDPHVRHSTYADLLSAPLDGVERAAVSRRKQRGDDAMSIFSDALEELIRSGADVRKPESFQKYASRVAGGSRVDTAAAISIQDFESLPRDLARAQVMVLRLGRAGGRDGTTQFGLVRAERSVRDEFFLVDANLFPTTPSTFDVRSPQRLIPFQFLGKLVEASALSLAVASGALEHALALDPSSEPLIAAGGAGAYSFDVRPRGDLDVSWRHDQGQVEIDGLVVARRSGRACLLVIEAKWGAARGSLAKHKLVYPCLALHALGVVGDMPLVPVYVRAWRDDSAVHFKIAELRLEPQRAVSLLTRVGAAYLRMPFRLSSSDNVVVPTST